MECFKNLVRFVLAWVVVLPFLILMCPLGYLMDWLSCDNYNTTSSMWRDWWSWASYEGCRS